MPVKCTFPHMGNTYIPLKALLQELGHEVVVPPTCSQHTLSIGAAHSPETACLPLKVTIGNFLEAEQLGAEVAIMAGGTGPCRFGFYGQVQRETLRDMGSRLEIIVLEPPAGGWRGLISQIDRLRGSLPWSAVLKALQIAWAKFQAIDAIEAAVWRARPVAAEPAKVDAALAQILNRLDAAASLRSIKITVKEGVAELQGLQEPGRTPWLRVGLVGEIYTLLEPFVNLDIERMLGHSRVLVEKNIQIGHWVKHHLLFAFLQPHKQKKLTRKAKGYLGGPVGGHGLESVSHTIDFARSGVDGVLHLLPFTCMPELVAQSALANVSRDLGIPVMTLVLDEQTGEAGYETRIEAFLDLLSRRRQAKQEVAAR